MKTGQTSKKKLLKNLRKAIRSSDLLYREIARKAGVTLSIVDHLAAGCYPHVPSYTRVNKLLAAVQA